MKFNSESKITIVTGAARGIGKAITLRVLREGLSVLALDKDASALANLKLECNDKNDGSLLQTYELDLSQVSQIKLLFAQLTINNIRPYALVNNAGILLGTSLLEYSAEDVSKVLSVNLLGAFHMTQQFGKLRIIDKQPGAIVNITSIAGQIGGSDPIYAISKAGLLSLTKTAAMALAPNIRVNAVAPTLVQTDLIKHVDSARHKKLIRGELLKSPLLPEDVADSVWFLLSDQSKHFTGATLDINNGFSMR